MADKRILTEDERKLLEGLAPFNVNSTTEYIPKPHQALPEALRPVFKLRAFRKEEADVARKVLGALKDTDEQKLREMVRVVIQGMDNLYDAATGELIEFKAAPDGGMDKDLFSTIPINVSSDILLYVCRISGLLNPEKLGL